MAAKKKAALAKKRKLAEAKKQAAQQKLLAQKKVKKAAQKLMQQQLAAEQRSLDATRARQLQGEVDKYTLMITHAIGQNWLVPDAVKKTLNTKLLIKLAPGGVVIDVRLVKSSGDPALDRSAMAAVYKTSPLPVPKDPELFNKFRTLSLTVRPEGIISA